MPDTTMPPEATPPQLSQQEIDSGKTMAILSYIPIAFIGLIVAIVTYFTEEQFVCAVSRETGAGALHLLGSDRVVLPAAVLHLHRVSIADGHERGRAGVLRPRHH